MRTAIIIILSILSSMTLKAQDEFKAKINAIKLDSCYVSAESTNEVADSAKYYASKLLYTHLVNQSVRCDKAWLGSHAKYLFVKRGEKTRCFTYITKAELKSSHLYAANSVISGDDPNKQQTEISQQAVATDSSKLIVSTMTVPAVIEKVLTHKTIKEAYDFLKCDNRIADMGKCSSNNIPSDAYLVVFDRDFMIKALLLPENSGERLNAQTKIRDSWRHYSGCGMIWLKTK